MISKRLYTFCHLLTAKGIFVQAKKHCHSSEQAYNNSNGVQECDGTFINEFMLLLYYTNLIPGFSGLAGTLHQFRGVNGCYNNHRHLDATSLKANFLEANYKCKVTCITERKTMCEAQAMNSKTLAYLVVVIQANAIQTTVLSCF